MADRHVDARNLTCPLPVLKARKAIGELKAGQTLEVLATDPGAAADFRALCEATRHRLVEQTEAAGVYRFVIEVTR